MLVGMFVCVIVRMGTAHRLWTDLAVQFLGHMPAGDRIVGFDLNCGMTNVEANTQHAVKVMYYLAGIGHRHVVWQHHMTGHEVLAVADRPEMKIMHIDDRSNSPHLLHKLPDIKAIWRALEKDIRRLRDDSERRIQDKG